VSRRRILFILIAAAVVAVAFVAAFNSSGPKEPSYNGKTLSQWIDLAYSSPQAGEADDALRHIGTNAIPCLLDWLAYQPAPWRQKAKQFVLRLPVKARSPKLANWLLPNNHQKRAALAMHIFPRLGPGAPAAIPGLTRIMKNSKSRPVSMRAVVALVSLGKDALPPMLTALSDPTNPNRSFIAQMIPSIADLGTNGAAAVPVLISCLNDPDDKVAAQAAYALGLLQMQSDVVVPALIGSLANTHYLVRFYSARALAEFGEDAQAALPALKTALKDTNNIVRGAASDALSEIAPDESEKDQQTTERKNRSLVPSNE